MHRAPPGASGRRERSAGDQCGPVDATGLRYAGEGGLHIVFAVEGSSPREVVRVRKRLPSRRDEDGPAARAIDAWAWPGLLQEVQTRGAMAHAFGGAVMAPLVGASFVAETRRIATPTDAAVAALRACGERRPERWRQQTDQCLAHDLFDDTAELRLDYFEPDEPRGVPRGAPRCVLEVKPKWGLRPCTSAALAGPHADVRATTSRYRMHQALKVEEGRAAAPSAYEPADLLSGDGVRVLRALAALSDSPQNNLGVHGNTPPLDVLAAALCASGVLRAIRDVQALDVIGFPGAAALVGALRASLTSDAACADVGDATLPPAASVDLRALQIAVSDVGKTLEAAASSGAGADGALAALRCAGEHGGLSWAAARAALQGFQASMCARDCAIILQVWGPLEGGAGAGAAWAATRGVAECCACPERALVRRAGEVWRYRVYVSDLDIKPLTRVDEWLRKDARITEAYVRSTRPDIAN
ncbi:unnamed protein product [Pedinophyceae sp. YPF-701]|nr:unnamed protein product [Pedinophyceae sp. YPF-701]